MIRYGWQIEEPVRAAVVGDAQMIEQQGHSQLYRVAEGPREASEMVRARGYVE